MNLYLVDNGECVALARAPNILHALTIVNLPNAHAALVETEGDAMILWVQGEPIGLRELWH